MTRRCFSTIIDTLLPSALTAKLHKSSLMFARSRIAVGMVIFVYLSDELYCGIQGQFRGLRVILSSSYSLLHTLLLYDVVV